jgi:undecaprenyl-phosphate galactose phosphotransferase
MDVQAVTERQLAVRSRRAMLEAWLLAGLDIVVILACFIAGRSMNYLVSGIPWHATWYHWRIHYGDVRIVIFIGLAFGCIYAFWRLGHYARRRPFWQELGDICGVVMTMAVVDAALVFMTKSNFSRLWWATSWGLILILVPLCRILIKRLLLTSGAWKRPTVILGTGLNALDAAAALDSEPLLGFEVVAFIEPPRSVASCGCDPGLSEAGAADFVDERTTASYLKIDGKRLPVLRASPHPELLPAHLGRPHVVVALEMGEMVRCGSFVERLSRLHYGDVDIVSPMRGLPLAGTQVTHYFSHDVLALRLYNNLARPWPRRVKRAFDLVFGGLLLVLLSPLFALISWGVARSGGPVFYGQERIGKSGRRFTCLKFRTMVPDADRVLEEHLVAHPEARTEWQRDHKLKDDPRITRVGAWLRRVSLDELPQLINVMRGEMSLVGPRPVVAEELPRYGDDIYYYFESTPGMTGLWQVSGRNDLDYRRRVHLDCWYARNWSLWCDLVILFKTPRAVLRGRGAY